MKQNFFPSLSFFCCLGLIASMLVFCVEGAIAKDVGQRKETFYYDQLGRLIEVHYGNTVPCTTDHFLSYSYDAAGNRSHVGIITRSFAGCGSGGFSIGNAAKNEGEKLTFSLSRSGDLQQPTFVELQTVPGTATPDVDYVPRNETIEFAPGQSLYVLEVDTLSDSDVESVETVFVEIVSVSNGSMVTSEGTGTIYDPPSFAVSTPTASEGSDLVFLITKTGETHQDYTVTYETADGSGVAGSDYTGLPSTSFTFAPNVTTYEVPVNALTDSTLEAAETVILDLTAASGGAGFSDGTGTITDDGNSVPAFTINNQTVDEGSTVNLTVTMIGSSTFTHTIDAATRNSSAVAGADYAAHSEQLSFAPGETTKSFTFSTLSDNINEAQERVWVDLTNASDGATISDNLGRVYINDDVNDVPPSFSINNQTVAEGVPVGLTITKVGATELTYTIDAATRNSSAAAGSDYDAHTETLTFAPGEMTKTFPFTTIDDSIDEAQERVWVDLTNASGGATISDNLVRVFINDNDNEPTFKINNKTVTEGQTLVFTVTKTGATQQTFTVDAATRNSTAVAGADYVANSQTLTFPASTNQVTFSVQTLTDSVNEAQERVWIDLTNASNGATFTDNLGQGKIDNLFVNSPPNAVGDITSLGVGLFTSIDVRSNDSDPDGDPLTVTSVTQPWNATVTILSNGSLFISSSSVGSGNFTYTVSDGNGGTDTATVSVTVTGGGGGPPPF